jgi:hypothetical protein
MREGTNMRQKQSLVAAILQPLQLQPIQLQPIQLLAFTAQRLGSAGNRQRRGKEREILDCPATTE